VEIREATKTLEDFLIIIELMQKHPKEWDCSSDDFVALNMKVFVNPLVRGWIAYHEEKPVGCMTAYRNKGFMDQIDVLGTYVEPIGVFKDCILALSWNVMEWAVSEKAKRITWNTSANLSAWKRHLEQLANDRFKIDGIKEKVSLTWESGG
jgi:hypothetical protein